MIDEGIPKRGARETGTLWARFARSHARTATGALLFAAAAATYALLVGCKTGTCPLTSNVWTASLYGAVVGGLLGWPDRALRPDEARSRRGGTDTGARCIRDRAR
ncbi:MAG: DUF6132 family protein [Myxococcales bacterium]